MIETIKFSQMTDAGDVNNNDIMPSLRGGENVILNNPWTFLPPGTTAERPTPSTTVNFRLRFNTDEQLYEYYDAVLGAWTQLQESLFTQGPFITYTADASIPDAQNLGALADGILKQTITLGVATLDIALNGTDYYGPGFVIPPTSGGTGVNNGSRTLTLAGSLATVGAFPAIFNFTASTDVIFPTSGTLATTAQIPTGEALTKSNDTNVTLTLGGSPLTALLNATSLTLGWTGTLSGTRGGTGVNNGSSTATYAGNLNFAGAFSTVGAFAVTQTYTGITNVTFPQSGTLATTTGSVATLTGNSGTATANSGNINVVGGTTGLTFSGATDTLTLGGTLNVNNGGTGLTSITSHNLMIGNGTSALTLLAPSATSGIALISQGASSNPIYGTVVVAGGGTGAVTLTGLLTGNGTSAITGTAITQYNVLTGGVSNAPNSVAPSATSGVPLISQGSSSQPIFGTAAIAGGGTGVTSVTTSPTASAWAGWDANANMSADSFLSGYTTTATAAGTTTLTVNDTYWQYFTGSTTQTVTLPVTSTLALGQSFYLVNNSSGSVTVQSSGANTVLVLAANTSAIFTCILTSGTTAASWNYIYDFNAGGSGTVSAGTANQLAYYASSGTTIVGLASANNGVLVTSAGGVPSIATSNAITNTLLSNMSNLTIKGNVSGGSAAPSDLTATQVRALLGGNLLNVQVFTANGTWTPTSGTTRAIIVCTGGGGGGGGSGTAAGSAAGTGGTSSVGSIASASGGTGGGWVGASGAGGAGATGTSLTTGGGGSGGGVPSAAQGSSGGKGGESYFGGGGKCGNAGSVGGAGSNGGGGGGGGGLASANYSGGGGGAGGTAIAYATGISGTYVVTVGAAGTAGGAGTSGSAGGAGGVGHIDIYEYA